MHEIVKESLGVGFAFERIQMEGRRDSLTSKDKEEIDLDGKYMGNECNATQFMSG